MNLSVFFETDLGHEQLLEFQQIRLVQQPGLDSHDDFAVRAAVTAQGQIVDGLVQVFRDTDHKFGGGARRASVGGFGACHVKFPCKSKILEARDWVMVP